MLFYRKSLVETGRAPSKINCEIVKLSNCSLFLFSQQWRSTPVAVA